MSQRSQIRASQINQDAFTEAINQTVAYFNYYYQPVFATGNQIISGIKTFVQIPMISGAPFIAGTGDQIIGGVKTFYDLTQFATGADFNNMEVFHPDFQEGSSIYNANNNNLINFEVGYLGNAASGVNLNWVNQQLTGNWLTNTVPTTGYHLINKSYLDGGATNIVRTTGAQILADYKSFSTGILVSNIRAYVVNGAAIVTPSIYMNDGTNESAASGYLLSNANTVSLDWVRKILTGNWVTNTNPSLSGHIINKGYLSGNYVNFKTGLSIGTGDNISYFSSGRATLTTGAADVVFPPMSPSTNILLTNQSGNGTPGWLRIVNRQNNIGFSIESSSATDTSLVYWEAKM